MFENKKIALIGGSGSFGSAFLMHLLNNYNSLERVLIYSRGEQKQYELQSNLTKEQRRRVKFVIGDIRDAQRVNEALYEIDIVVLAAAMKHLPIAESNPEECYKTNLEGTTNVIRAAINNGVEKFVALSTDKAVLPINVYGATKLLLERLVTKANFQDRNKHTIFSVVRYANVFGSRGSVIPFFLAQKEKGVLPITDPAMTRFSLSMNDGIKLVINALSTALGGETFVPKAPSYKITTVADAICPNCKIDVVGVRIGEKIRELMVSKFEAPRTVEKEDCYVVLSEESSLNISEYIDQYKGSLVADDFEYDSATNTNWLSVNDLQQQIKSLTKVNA